MSALIPEESEIATALNSLSRYVEAEGRRHATYEAARSDSDCPQGEDFRNHRGSLKKLWDKHGYSVATDDAMAFQFLLEYHVTCVCEDHPVESVDGIAGKGLLLATLIDTLGIESFGEILHDSLLCRSIIEDADQLATLTGRAA
jgi:hypothetical protein